MNESNNIHRILGSILLLTGIITYLTPIPGSTILIILGLVWLIGKERTLHFLREVLGKRLLKFLKIERLIKKV